MPEGVEIIALTYGEDHDSGGISVVKTRLEEIISDEAPEAVDEEGEGEAEGEEGGEKEGEEDPREGQSEVQEGSDRIGRARPDAAQHDFETIARSEHDSGR